eukprot:scaffold26093_cov16-Tisochrysis_lutea.AAC.3
MPNINVDINVLEFRDICSYAVLGGMGAQAKFNMYLGKLDPMDWNYKYLNPVTLARAVRSKGASMGHPMRYVKAVNVCVGWSGVLVPHICQGSRMAMAHS